MVAKFNNKLKYTSQLSVVGLTQNQWYQMTGLHGANSKFLLFNQQVDELYITF